MPRVPVISPHVNGLIEYMVSTAGSSKIVFGSDLPWYSQHYHAGAVLFSRITDEARHDILHRNAERLLGSHLNGDGHAATPAAHVPLPVKSRRSVAFRGNDLMNRGVLLLFLLAVLPAQARGAAPVPIIFDTDIMSDVDDVGAVAILHCAGRSGRG